MSETTDDMLSEDAVVTETETAAKKPRGRKPKASSASTETQAPPEVKEEPVAPPPKPVPVKPRTEKVMVTTTLRGSRRVIGIDFDKTPKPIDLAALSKDDRDALVNDLGLVVAPSE